MPLAWVVIFVAVFLTDAVARRLPPLPAAKLYARSIPLRLLLQPLSG